MLNIDRFSDIPVYEQIINAIERDISLGVIKKEEKLPSVRELASSLGVNPNTVQKAYTELQARGVIITVASSGAYVSKDAHNCIIAHKSELLTKIRESLVELRYAGIDEERITSIVKEVFSFESEAPSASRVVPTKQQSEKKRSAPSAKKETTATKKVVKEEAPAPQITRRKMGIELL